MGLIVTTFFAPLMVASKPMAVPLALVSLSIRMPSMLLLVKSVLALFALIASLNVSVMLLPASVTVAALAGLKVCTVGAVVSGSLMVTVAVAVLPEATVQPLTPLAGAIVTVKVSFASADESVAMGTESVAVLLPLVTVTVDGVVPVSSADALPE